MGRIENTVFISYRRTHIAWALAIFKELTHHGYDVFIDYDGLASGNFETAILENIRARAHFVLLLTPTALERCSDPQDWMRREIKAAMDSHRNIVPLMLDGFSFGTVVATGQLIGKLKKYNGLEVPGAYFDAAMERLRNRFLNVPIDAVVHSASVSAQQVAREQKDKAEVVLPSISAGADRANSSLLPEATQVVVNAAHSSAEEQEIDLPHPISTANDEEWPRRIGLYALT
jgi:hypothetical protein